MKAFIDSSALTSNPDALRDRFDRDGYIYLPGLLDTQPLLELRRQIVVICIAGITPIIPTLLIPQLELTAETNQHSLLG